MSTEPAPAPAPDWYAADKAYQLHHFNCPTCRSAGASLSRTLCAVGQALWGTYEAAGMPPHFTWLHQREKNHEPTKQRHPDHHA